jgi:excisionase family DNA binding protein
LSRLSRRSVDQIPLPGEFGGRFGLLTVNNNMGSEQSSQIDLLKPAEVAARLGVSRTWLYAAAKAGRIPSIRIGGSDGPLRFVRDDLQRWIEAARAEWTPAATTPRIGATSSDLLDAFPRPGSHGRSRHRR